MAKLFYLHWHEAELRERVAPLRKAGYDVAGHANIETLAQFGEALPDAVIISLDRLPSHGRTVAEWFWEAKKRQHVPIIFAGGEPDKIKTKRKNFLRRFFAPQQNCPNGSRAW